MDLCNKMPLDAMTQIILSQQKREKAAKMAENHSSSCSDGKNQSDRESDKNNSPKS
jgi:hypothetical protein